MSGYGKIPEKLLGRLSKIKFLQIRVAQAQIMIFDLSQIVIFDLLLATD